MQDINWFFEQFQFGEFKPCIHYNEGLDFFEYIGEDCTYVSEHQPGSPVVLLRKWDGEKYCGIVGIQIWNFSSVATKEVIDAIKNRF